MAKTATAPVTKSALLETVKSIVGNDVLMLFGETGTGKSKLVHEFARATMAEGGSVFVLDTERNLSRREVESLGGGYKYTPVFGEIRKVVGNLPKADFVAVDSIGLPVLIQYSRMNMRDRLYAFLEMASLLGDLKDWSYQNKALAVVTNQPVSEFESDERRRDEPRDPFGGKSKFVAKEIWQTALVSRDRTATRLMLSAFRSRELAFGTVIAELTVTDAGLDAVVRLERAVSPDLVQSLSDEILRANAVKDLEEIRQRINTIKHQLSDDQRKDLRDKWMLRRKELPEDEVIPDGQTQLPT